MIALAPRTRSSSHLVSSAVVVGLVVVLGLLAAANVVFAVGFVGLGLVVALAFVAPAVNLTLIVFITAIVPFTVQNQLAGSGRGVIMSDVLLLTALMRVAPGVVAGATLDRRQRTVLIPLTAFVAIVILQFARGLASGSDVSTAGVELRTLMGFATFLVAIPLLRDENGRRQLLKGLLLTGLALGLWGMAQWVFDLRFEGEFGVREGIPFTTSGRGQLQGGMYAFPVAAILGFAALVSGAVRQGRHRGLVATVTLLNLLCVLLTYERTFWVGTVVAMAFVAIRSGHGPRTRALLWGPAIVFVVLAGMATLAPGALGAAQERLLSLAQYASDSSIRYRLVESEHVLDQIRARPVLGSGLGAEIVWSRPWHGVPARAYHYTHNGYLWVGWKLGLPAALLLFGTLFAAIVRRPPPGYEPLLRSMHHGSQGALLLLMISSLTFPSFNTYGITATMGVLLAFCSLPLRSSPRERSLPGARAPVSAE